MEVRNLHLYHGSAHIIQGVEFKLEKGALAIVGSNGMGKSTLCDGIMGLLPAREGSISLNGRQVLGKPPHVVARSGVGYVPQGRRLWPSLRVDEHLEMLDNNGSWDRQAVYSIFPKLAERRSNLSSQLSGGEQQMLAIGRALLGNTNLLVMDEPTEGLAPSIVKGIIKLIKDIVSNGVAVLIIEQNIGVATSVSENTAVMVNGRISRKLPSEELAADIELQRSLLGFGRSVSASA